MTVVLRDYATSFFMGVYSPHLCGNAPPLTLMLYELL